MKLSKKFAALVLAAVLVFTLMPSAYAAGDPVTYAVSDLLLNVTTGEEYYEKNVDTLRNPASLTKLMTTYMVYEAIRRGEISKSSRVVVSAHAAAVAADTDASNVPLTQGASYTVDELLQATLTVSACGAACALGEKLGGSESAFASKMTARAQSLGWSMRFTDASGLDGNSRVTARALGSLATSLLTRYPDVLNYTARTSINFRGKTYKTTNYLLPGGTYAYSGADGLKTGTMSTAGKCLVATAQRNGQRLVAVILGGNSDSVRFGDAVRMLDSGFARAITLTRSQSSFAVNGAAAAIHAYTYNGSNYVCLRDLSAALAGTSNSYSVNWDAATNVITLATGGTASASTENCPDTAAVKKGTAGFVINGGSVAVESFTVGGVTYAALRAIAPALGLEISFDSAANRVLLTTDSATRAKTQLCTLDGKTLELSVCLIDGTGYYKLRDVASTLSGTAQQFDVSWDAAAATVALVSGKAYTPVGGELAAADGALRFAVKTRAAVRLDGQTIAPAAYNIGGNNWFKLRDLGAALGFGVDWNRETGTVVLTTHAVETPSPSVSPAASVSPSPSPETLVFPAA